MRMFLLLFFSFSAYAVEYSAVHEDTYWFPEEERTLKGSFYGSVRSNVAWGERLSFFVSKKECDAKPVMMMTLHSKATYQLKNENKNFKLSSLEETFLYFDVQMDNEEPVVLESVIWAGREGRAENDFFIIIIREMPEYFWNPSKKVMTMTIREDDPNRKYFDVTKRQYRMEGIVPVWMHLHDLCLEATKQKPSLKPVPKKESNLTRLSSNTLK